MDSETQTALGEVVRFRIRINAIGKEDVNQVVVRVTPKDGSSETLMSESS